MDSCFVMEDCVHCASCRGMRSPTRPESLSIRTMWMWICLNQPLLLLSGYPVLLCVWLCVLVHFHEEWIPFQVIYADQCATWIILKEHTHKYGRVTVYTNEQKKWRTLFFTQSIYPSIYPCFLAHAHAYSTHTNANLHLGPVEVCLKINENKWDEICLLCTV